MSDKSKDEIRREKVKNDFNSLTEKEKMEREYKFIATSYRLISEALHQGKNTYLITDTLEFLELKYQDLFDKLKDITPKEKD